MPALDLLQGFLKFFQKFFKSESYIYTNKSENYRRFEISLHHYEQQNV